MELTEVSTLAYKNEPYIAFGLNRTADENIFCAANRHAAQILQLNYSHHYDGNVHVQQSSMTDICTFMPSKCIPKDSAHIFNSSKKDQQHRLLIDPHLMTEELKITKQNVSIVSTHWSPKLNDAVTKYYLAYLTNFGGCEIRSLHTAKRSWSIVVCNVAKDWMNVQIKKTITSFSAVENAVFDAQITAFSWHNVLMQSYLKLAIVNANGTIVVYDLRNDGLLLNFHKKFNQKKVNALEWFSFYDKHDKLRSYIVSSDVKGSITLYAVHFGENDGSVNDIVEKQQLFDENDGVRGNGIRWEYCDQIDKFIIVVCKGMHVFAYFLSTDCDILSSHIHYIGNLVINGITKRNPLEYIIGTLNGKVKCLRIKLTQDEISMTTDEYKNPINPAKYALYGLACSTNNALLFMTLFAAQPYDHLALREPAAITVCQQIDGLRCLEMLLSNSTQKLAHFHDLAESVRCSQLKNDNLFEKYLKTLPMEITCSDAYLYELKVRLIVTSARSTYLRLKNRLTESSYLLGEYDVIKKFILIILSFRTLSHLNRLKGVLKPFQMLSAQCHRTFLREFLSFSIFEEYEVIKQKFHPAIEILLAETELFDEHQLEVCVYCDQPIEIGKSVCNDGHEMPRCCISMVQVPLMNQRNCPPCQTVALDDLEKLKQIVTQNDKIEDEVLCPLCDLEMHFSYLSYVNHTD